MLLTHTNYAHIRRPLQSVERVRLHLLAYNIQPSPSPTSRSKAQQKTSVQPAKVARQLKSRNPTLRAPWPRPGSWSPGSLRAPRQLESWNLTVQVPRQLESKNLIILSSL